MWPIILWSGRTARPSTCQSRTRDSQACGSVKPPCARTVSTKRESWVVVATYAQTMPPGTSASAAAPRHSQGASMSRMIRSQRSPLAGRASARSPRVRVHAGWLVPSGAEKNWSTLRRATSANSSRRS